MVTFQFHWSDEMVTIMVRRLISDWRASSTQELGIPKEII